MKSTWRLCILALASTLCSLASAQAPDFAAPPPPGPPRTLSIDVPTEQRLPNGLRVVLAQRRGVQLVTAELMVLSGSEIDPEGKAGLVAMTAELLTRGTRLHGATELARAAESLGGSLDSGAGWHEASVDITVAVPKLDPALALLSEVVQQPAFAEDELERLRTQSLDELKVSYSRPGTLASLVSRRLIYGAGAYGHPSAGTPESLPRITRADLTWMHDAAFRPDNAVLVLAGDLDAESALRLANRHFGSWQSPTARPAIGDVRPNAELPLPAVVIDMPDSGQAAVVVATPLPPPGSDRAAAVVTNAVLGGGYSSRLNQEIRIQRGLSYSAGSSLDLQEGGGSLHASVQTKNESAAEVVSLVQREFDRLATTPVPAQELEARKATLIGDVSRGIETTAGLGGAVAALLVDGRPLSELRTRIDTLSAVTAQDVQRYASANFRAAARKLVVAGDATHFKAALNASTPGMTVLPAAGFRLDKLGVTHPRPWPGSP